MFKITEGVVAILMLAGLDEPPEADQFSKDTVNSYFAQAGLDVSLVWIGAELHGRMMQQHRDNLQTPQQVTVERIEEVTLGDQPVTEVVYYKSRTVPDLDNPGAIIEGREATWQYIWPGDSGQSHALLTIWRSGVDEISKLESGFSDMRSRWQAGAALPGALYDLHSAIEEDRLVLTGISVEAPQLSWGQVKVPVFHDYDDWQVVVTPPLIETVTVPDPILLVVPGMLEAEDLTKEIEILEAWLSDWSPLFEEFSQRVDRAGTVFRDAVRSADEEGDPDGSLSLFEAVMDEESGSLQLNFLIERPGGDTHEGWVRLNAKGQVTGTELYW